MPIRKIVVDALRQLTFLSGTSKETDIAGSKAITRDQINFELENEYSFRIPVTGNLNIETSPVPSAHSCSTDTASETGSAFNSPNQIQQIQLHPPSSADLANSTFVKDFSRLVVVKMSSQSTVDFTVDGRTLHITTITLVDLTISPQFLRYQI